MHFHDKESIFETFSLTLPVLIYFTPFIIKKYQFPHSIIVISYDDDDDHHHHYSTQTGFTGVNSHLDHSFRSCAAILKLSAVGCTFFYCRKIGKKNGK